MHELENLCISINKLIYRPISIVSVVANVFERIIYDQLYLFLTENSLLTNCQSGFRGLHSTVTALLEATNDWAYNIDHGFWMPSCHYYLTYLFIIILLSIYNHSFS